jgi:hypothetical protein
MQTIISHPFIIFPTFEAASKLAEANQAEDDVTEYRVTKLNDGRFVVAMFEDGEFMMNL